MQKFVVDMDNTQIEIVLRNPTQEHRFEWLKFTAEKAKQAKEAGITDGKAEDMTKAFELMKQIELKKIEMLIKLCASNNLRTVEDALKISASDIAKMWEWVERSIGVKVDNQDFMKP